MSNLTLDSLTLYGLYEIPSTINVSNTQLYPIMRSHTEIMEVTGLRLPMNQNHMVTWEVSENPIVQPPDTVYTDPKYRVDCHPDNSKEKSFFFLKDKINLLRCR